MLKRQNMLIASALTLAIALSGCGSTTTTTEAETSTSATSVEAVSQETTETAGATSSTTTVQATSGTLTLTSGQDSTITEAGTYVVTGTATDSTIVVDALDGEVTLVLSGVTIENADFPAIYVKSAGDVTIELADGTQNSLTVTGEFTADGDTNTDGVIFSHDDLTFTGNGSLTVSSTKHGVVSKDDLTIESGTVTINAQSKGLQANDEVKVKGGSVTITAAEGIESTIVTIKGGSTWIVATDDGINATARSDKEDIGTPTIQIEDGELTVEMGQGDTDALDSNGNIYVSGGTVTITGQFAFDFDGQGSLTGGTVTVNGEQVTEITNSMMGGGMGGFGGGMAGGMRGGGAPMA